MCAVSDELSGTDQPLDDGAPATATEGDSAVVTSAGDEADADATSLGAAPSDTAPEPVPGEATPEPVQSDTAQEPVQSDTAPEPVPGDTASSAPAGGWAMESQQTAPIAAQETSQVAAPPTEVAAVLPPDPAATWANSGSKSGPGSGSGASAPPPRSSNDKPRTRRGLGAGLLIGALAGGLVAVPVTLALRSDDNDQTVASQSQDDSAAVDSEAGSDPLPPGLDNDDAAADSDVPANADELSPPDDEAAADDETTADDEATVDDETTAAGGGGSGLDGEATPGVIRSVLADVGDAVVSINTTGFQEGLAQNVFPTAGAGSGVIIEDSGLILTNAHVVAGATEISVRFADGDEAKGTVVGRSTVTDLALVQVETDKELVAATLADSDEVAVGDSVIAIGNALALPGGPTVTTGIISAVDREIRTTGGVLTGLLQTSAAINPGNSGGPLLNVDGEVIGINTAVAGDAQNIGFAVAGSMALREVDAMTNGDGRTTDQGFLGVSTQELTPAIAAELGVTSDFGAVVVEVVPGSAADEAGLEPRDVIVQVDGKDVRSPEAVRDAVGARKSGELVEIKWLRGSESKVATATLQARPVE